MSIEYHANPGVPTYIERWLHVRADGQELWFDRCPGDVFIKTLRVHIFPDAHQRLIQQTYTKNLLHFVDEYVHVVKPRGSDWSFVCLADDKSSIWRRTVNNTVVTVVSEKQRREIIDQERGQ